MATKVSTPQPIDITPGVQPPTDRTSASTPHYTAMKGIRFQTGQAQKIGGNIQLNFDYGATVKGTIRNIFTSIVQDQFYAIEGTEQKLYAIIGSRLENITPFQTSSVAAANSLSTQYSTLGSNPFSAQIGSMTLTVTDPDAGRFQAGDTVYFSGATGFAGISAGALNAPQVVRSLGIGTYTINIGTAATSTASGGGSAVVRSSGLVRVTSANTLANGDRVKIENAAVFNAASATVAMDGTGYAPNDILTVQGGTFSTASTFTVATTKLISALLGTSQSGIGSYAPNDTLTVVGGSGTAATYTINTTQVISATVAAGGTGGPNGFQLAQGMTGTGVKFQAIVNIAGGSVVAVEQVTLAGSYTVNPTTLTAEPIGCGALSGATLNITMGPAQITYATGGAYTANPPTTANTTTSGSGTGATLTNLVFGVNTVTLLAAGNYTVKPTNPTQDTDSGTGTGATLTITYTGTGSFGGITNLQIDQTFSVRNVSASYFDVLTGGRATSSVTAAGGSLTDYYLEITPGSLNEVASQGYGAGLYGVGLYGTALISSSGRTLPRIWFVDRYANTFIMTPGNQGGLYQWFGNANEGPDAIGGSNAPTAVNYAFIASNILVTLGAGGIENRIFASDQDDITNWISSSTNQVFDDDIEGAGRFLSHCPVQGLNLLFTQNQTYTFRYIGLPLVWEILQLDESIGIIAPLARVPVKGNAYWMGLNNFYMYRGGKVEIIPANSQAQCTALNYVFENLNVGQKSKIHAWYNVAFNEVWFHYPSAASNECDSVVRVCLLDNTWTIDEMTRTASENPAVTQQNPLLANVGTTFRHEFGTDDNGQPLAWSLTGPRRNYGAIVNNSGIMPDSIQTGDINLNVTAYRYAQSATPTFNQDYTISPNTEQMPVTIGGRLATYTWSGAVLGQEWQMGEWTEALQLGATQ